MDERAARALNVMRAMIENGYELYEEPARSFLVHEHKRLPEEENTKLVETLYGEFPEQIRRAYEITDLNRKLEE